MTELAKSMLQRVGEGLYGPRWQTDLSNDLGVADRTMRRWLADQASMPSGAWQDLTTLLGHRVDQITRIRDALEMLVGGRPLVLKPIAHALPAYDVSGLTFAMVDPKARRQLTCFIWRSVFEDRKCTSRGSALAYFNEHHTRFYAAASALYVLGEFEAEDRITIGDVILP